MTFDDFSEPDIFLHGFETDSHLLTDFGIRNNHNISLFHFCNPITLITETLDLDFACLSFRHGRSF